MWHKIYLSDIWYTDIHAHTHGHMCMNPFHLTAVSMFVEATDSIHDLQPCTGTECLYSLCFFSILLNIVLSRRIPFDNSSESPCN